MRRILHRLTLLLLVVSAITWGCGSSQKDGSGSENPVNQYNAAGNKEGLWNEYEDSSLVARGSYQDGAPDGLWTYYYREGQIKAEGHYRKGVKEGMWVEWYRDGEIMWKGEWIHGKRQIEYEGSEPRVTFLELDRPGDLLGADSQYRVQIRIQNIPSSHLFVEVSSGSIHREEDSDLFELNTSSDSIMTMAIGYIPDLDFMDFRDLVQEIRFQIK